MHILFICWYLPTLMCNLIISCQCLNFGGQICIFSLFCRFRLIFNMVLFSNHYVGIFQISFIFLFNISTVNIQPCIRVNMPLYEMTVQFPGHFRRYDCKDHTALGKTVDELYVDILVSWFKNSFKRQMVGTVNIVVIIIFITFPVYLNIC